MDLRYWRTTAFWLTYLGLLLPSLFVFALPGAIFVDEGTGAIKCIGIFASQELLAVLVPWLLAREIAKASLAREARDEQRRRGFPVIQREAIE